VENGQRNGLGKNGPLSRSGTGARQSGGVRLEEPDKFRIPTLARPEVHAEDHAQKGSSCQAAPSGRQDGGSEQTRLGAGAVGPTRHFRSPHAKAGTGNARRRPLSLTLSPLARGEGTGKALPNPARAGRGNRKGSCHRLTACLHRRAG
jgi:hypothetical protein